MLGMLMHVNNRTHPSIFRLSIARLSFRSLARADEVRIRVASSAVVYKIVNQ
jgi:hypothetical protein